MYVAVESTAVPADEVARRTGLEPDEARVLGVTARPQGPPSRWHSWIRYARADVPGPRVEDLEADVLGWGMDVATELGGLVASGDTTVSLVIVQRIEDPDDPAQKGITLSEGLVRWLAAAAASVAIDQYVILD